MIQDDDRPGQCGLLDWGAPGSEDKELKFDAFGIIPGKMIDYGARVLKPVENYIGSYLTLWDNLDNPHIVEA